MIKKPLSKFRSLFAMLLLCLVALGLLFGGSPSAKAQETTNRTTVTRVAPGVSTVYTGNIGTGVIVTNAATFAVPTANNLAVQLVLNGLGAGATNTCAVALQSSLDRTNYINDATLTLTGTGATTTSCLSNLTTLARPYYRVRTVTSTANGTGTNLSISVLIGIKDGL